MRDERFLGASTQSTRPPRLFSARPMIFFCVVLLSAGLLACAKQMGGRATKGALATLDERSRQDQATGAEPPVAIIAGRVVDGAMARLSAPDQVLAIRRVVQSASSEAVVSALDAANRPATPGGKSQVETLAASTAGAVQSALIEGVAKELGRDGGGLLGRSLAATAGNAAVAATDGVLLRLLPDCGAQDPRCVDRRIAEISHDAAVGFMRGVRESIQFGLLLLAFVAGLACAALVSVALMLARRHHGRTHGGDEHGALAAR